MDDKTIKKLLEGLASRDERAEGRRERRGVFTEAVVSSAQEAYKDAKYSAQKLNEHEDQRYIG